MTVFFIMLVIALLIFIATGITYYQYSKIISKDPTHYGMVKTFRDNKVTRMLYFEMALGFVVVLIGMFYWLITGIG